MSLPVDESPATLDFPTLPASVQDFLHDWLPSQYAATHVAGALPARACSLLLQLGDAEPCWVGVEHGTVVVKSGAGAPEALLRLDASVAAFESLVVAASRDAGGRNPALRMLQIGAHATTEIQCATGAVKLVVSDGERTHEMHVGAGSTRLPVVCTLLCGLSDLRKIQAGQAQALDLFLGGSLRVDGDIQTALALGSLFI